METTGKTVRYHNCRVKRYDCGAVEIMAASKAIFKDKDAEADPRPVCPNIGTHKVATQTEKTERSARRARAKLHEYALANEWDWFVTLTLDETKIERYDIDEIMKKLKNWLSNQVKRYGLKYILIPELHKKGGIHFHGLFCGGALSAVDSGHTDSGGHSIYNLERWTYGFTTAIQLYGDFERAVGYVCKYMGKGVIDAPIGGRWFYHGGALKKADVELCDIAPDELRALHGDGHSFTIAETGTEFYLVRTNQSHNYEIGE